MTHLGIHLVDELEICGLVGARWCYPMEKYLNVLKKYVGNRVDKKHAWQLGTCMMRL
jgi:hypothetical protein